MSLPAVLSSPKLLRNPHDLSSMHQEPLSLRLSSRLSWLCQNFGSIYRILFSRHQQSLSIYHSLLFYSRSSRHLQTSRCFLSQCIRCHRPVCLPKTLRLTRHRRLHPILLYTPKKRFGLHSLPLPNRWLYYNFVRLLFFSRSGLDAGTGNTSRCYQKYKMFFGNE